MSKCTTCGNEITNGESYCKVCGAPNNLNAQTQNYAQTQPQSYAPTYHDVPKCTHCGHIGPWKVQSILRPMDIVITIVLLFLGVIPGIVYAGVVIAIRANKDNREKICTQCKSKNLFTFNY